MPQRQHGDHCGCCWAQDGSKVAWEKVASLAPAQQQPRDEGGAAPSGISLHTSPWCGSYAVTSAAFAPGLVGAKSLNSLQLKVWRQSPFLLAESARPAACKRTFCADRLPVEKKPAFCSYCVLWQVLIARFGRTRCESDVVVR